MAQAKSNQRKTQPSKKKTEATTDIEQGNGPSNMQPVNNEEPEPGQYDVRRETLDKGAASENDSGDHPRATQPKHTFTSVNGNLRSTN